MTTEWNKMIGANIRRLRIGKKMKQAKAAKRLGVSPSHLSNIENGRHAATPKLLKRVYIELGYLD